MSNPQEFKKVEWLKVSLQGKVKRIYNPSKNIKCLSNQIKSHFRELNGFSHTTQDELREYEFSIQWIQKGEPPITILDNDQLEEIYMMHGLSKSNQIPRFEIMVSPYYCFLSESNRNSEVKSSLIDPYDNIKMSSQYECSQSKQLPSQIQDFQYNDLLNDIEEKIESQESEEAYSDKFDSEEGLSSDEEEEDRQILQSLRHQIRLEIEKEAIILFDQFKQDEQNFHNEGQYEEEKHEQLKESQIMNIRVSMTSNNHRRDQQTQGNNLLSRFKTFFQKRRYSENPLLAVIQGPKELYLECDVNSLCFLTWKIKNQSIQKWPAGVQLVKIYSWPQLQINSSLINDQLMPSEQKDIEIQLVIPQEFAEQAQVMMFILLDDENEFIGEPLIAYIKIREKYQQLEQSDSQSQEFVRNRDTEDFTQYKLSDEKLLGMGSLLVDEGYGSFDRCYNIIRCMRGDIKKARECLSQLIFHECNLISICKNANSKQSFLNIPRRVFSYSPREGKSSRDEFERKQREKEFKEPEFEEDEMSFQDKHMILKSIFFTGFICLSAYMIHRKMRSLQEERKRRLTGMEEENPISAKFQDFGGEWILKDINGKDFGSKNLQGNYYLMYFGFSQCPDVCPISLMKMSKAIRKLKRSREGQQYFQIKGVFVTVNPEIDTPKKLQEFCQLFDSDLIGLREESSRSTNLLNMLKKYKVPIGLNPEERQDIKDYFDEKNSKRGFFSKIFRKKQEFDINEGMLNDHSKVFYLMAPDNKFLAFYNIDVDENELASHVLEEISYDIGIKYIGTGTKPPINNKDY